MTFRWISTARAAALARGASIGGLLCLIATGLHCVGPDGRLTLNPEATTQFAPRAGEAVIRLPGQVVEEVFDPAKLRAQSQETQGTARAIRTKVEAFDVDNVNRATDQAGRLIAEVRASDVPSAIRRIEETVATLRLKLDQFDMAEINASIDALRASLQQKADAIDVAAANRTIEEAHAAVAEAHKAIAALDEKISAVDVAAFNDTIHKLRATIGDFDIVAVNRTASGVEGILASTSTAVQAVMWGVVLALLLVVVYIVMRLVRLVRAKAT